MYTHHTALFVYFFFCKKIKEKRGFPFYYFISNNYYNNIYIRIGNWDMQFETTFYEVYMEK